MHSTRLGLCSPDVISNTKLPFSLAYTFLFLIVALEKKNTWVFHRFLIIVNLRGVQVYLLSNYSKLPSQNKV